MNILQALDDPAIFGHAFRNAGSWGAWRVFLAALFGLPLTPEQLAIYQQCTGRTMPPVTRAVEGWLVCGRRAGKSFILALVAVFLACFFDWRSHLNIGERGTIMIIAADRRQARVIMRYIKGLLQSVPMLAQLIEAERQEGIDLSNRLTIEVHSASFRTTRGYTIVAALLDELAFWRNDEGSSNPDHEIISSIRPSMATVPNAMLLCASSPYARRGALWEAYHRYFGQEGSLPILCWQADTRTMNPTVSRAFIDAEYEKDPVSAEAEFGAQFRTDVETYVSREAVEACVEWGCSERAPLDGTHYLGFVDVSGGGADSFALAVGHKQDDLAVLDCMREVQAATQSRRGDHRVRRPVEALSHQPGDRRQIWRRISPRAVPQARHPVRAEPRAEGCPLSRSAAAVEQQEGQAAGQRAADLTIDRAGKEHRARR